LLLGENVFFTTKLKSLKETVVEAERVGRV
jgi:hypothetical protein